MTEFGKIEGKTFLITGAASGLGAGQAESFLKEGAKSVAILDVAEEKGNELAEKLNQIYPGKVVFVKCDVGDEENIQAAFDHVVKAFGTLDVVINNAGILNDSPQMWKKQCDVNYRGLVSLTLKGIEHMRVDEGGKGGTIINMASTLALTKYPFLPIYSGTKAAILHFSQCIAGGPFHETTNVRILTICFGPTRTPLLANLGATGYDKISNKAMSDLDETHRQEPESAVKGVVYMFKHGSNGSVWLATHNRPVQDITTDINNAAESIEKKYSLI